MQFNPIAQLTAAPSSAPSSSSTEAREDKGFSKMLGDAGAKGGSEQQKQSLPKESKSAAITAQEVPAQQPAAPLPADKVTQMMGKQIGPDEAKAILAKLADMETNGGHAGDPAFDQLKEALEDIAAGGETTDLGSMLEALPDMAEAKPEERAPTLQRLMGWVSAALDKHKEAPAAGAMPDGTVQSLQATLFPTGDDAAQLAAQAAAAQAELDKKNAAANAAAQAAATVAIIVPTVQTTAMPEWVKKLGEGEENIAADAINEAIPPLTLPESESDAMLPVVTLPGEDSMLAKAEPKLGARQFHEFLNGNAVANDNLAAHDNDAPTVAIDTSGVVAVPHTSSAHNTSTTTPITIAAHAHLATHTAAAEQVQVAITTMKKEDITSITMQLEPADLGRVEIKMDTIDGRTHLSFVVDKAETLDALSRDARSLERQLQESGIRADAGTMQFNLRQQPQQQEQAEFDGGDGSNKRAGGVEESAAAEGVVTRHYTLNVKEGVDIHA